MTFDGWTSGSIHFDILESFFDDVAGSIEWGGDDYNGTSLFDVSNLAEGSDTGPSDESGMAATEGSMQLLR